METEVQKYTVAFQGELGAFSEEAILAYLGEAQADPVPMPTFEAVFEALTRGEVDRAMIPIEKFPFWKRARELRFVTNP